MPEVDGIAHDSVYRALFAAYPDALLVCDDRGVIVLANPSAATLLGYTIDELVGLGIEALLPKAMRARHAAHRAAYSVNPEARPMGLDMDLVARHKDGSEVRVEIALSPLRGPAGPLVVAAMRDIGAYPRVRKALQRAGYSEHLAQLGRLAVDARDPQTVLERAPHIAAQALPVDTAMVWRVDGDGRRCRLVSGTGLVPGEALGAHVANTPDTPPGFALAQGRAVEVSDYRVERRFAVPQTYLDAGLVSALMVPFFDRGRPSGVLAVCARDARRYGVDEVQFLESLSNLLATSLQRAHSEEALNHSQRLEAVGQLTGGIAHDFNNLLTVIQGNLQVLEELPALTTNDRAQQLVAAAARASRRGAELTGKLLAFSRRQVLQPSAIDVNALLLSLADLLRRTLDQRIRIEVDAPPCPPCLADAGQLESALLNIAINARDAMPGGGSLRFGAAPCARLPDDVHGGPDPAPPFAAAFVAISIADDGEGMPEDVKERAFEPFFTTKEAGRGTGLGLSTVYGFVKQSKGGVTIDSAPGHGTTVTLYIPSATRAASADATTGPGNEPPRGLRVLLVEDDADVRAVIHAFLDTLGCEVTACENAERALAALGSAAGFDLLVTDIALGAGMRGTELAARAQAQRPALGVLLMSGYSAELLDADRVSPPGWELLRKPCSRAELARAMAQVIGA